jgi:DNA-binding beta-propeller fold protein YncE
MFASLMVAAALIGSGVHSIAVGANGLGIRTPILGAGVTPHRTASHGWLSPDAHGKTVFFVSNLVQEAIEIFDAEDPTGPAPIGSITDGISAPAGVALAPDGRLFVANSGSNTITEYPRGQLTPSETLSVGLHYPNFIAVGPHGELAVANITRNPYVSEFTPRGTKPFRNLRCTTVPLGLAYDAAGNLYIADDIGGTFGQSRILRVAPGSDECVDLGLSGFAVVQGLAVDRAGNIWIGDVFNSDVTMIPAGSKQPGPLVMYEFLTPVSLAFDASERHLYVADYRALSVLKLPYGSNAHFISWWDYVQDPLGVAISRGEWI